MTVDSLTSGTDSRWAFCAARTCETFNMPTAPTGRRRLADLVHVLPQTVHDVALAHIGVQLGESLHHRGLHMHR